MFYDNSGYLVIEFYDLEKPTKAIKVNAIQDLLRRTVEILAQRPRK